MTVAPPRRPLIVPSVLPADFARLGEAVRALCDTGVDQIQWDVMNGVFVPNLTFGPEVIAAAKPHSTVGFEGHLMVVNPDDLPVQGDECTTGWLGQGLAMHPGHLQGSQITAGRGGPGPDHVLTAGSVLRCVHEYLRDRA